MLESSQFSYNFQKDTIWTRRMVIKVIRKAPPTSMWLVDRKTPNPQIQPKVWNGGRDTRVFAVNKSTLEWVCLLLQVWNKTWKNLCPRVDFEPQTFRFLVQCSNLATELWKAFVVNRLLVLFIVGLNQDEHCLARPEQIKSYININNVLFIYSPCTIMLYLSSLLFHVSSPLLMK